MNTIGDIRLRIGKAAKCTGQILWQEEGPKETAIYHHAMMMFGSTMIYVQTLEDHDWEAFLPVTQPLTDEHRTFESIIRSINPQTKGAQ